MDIGSVDVLTIDNLESSCTIQKWWFHLRDGLYNKYQEFAECDWLLYYSCEPKRVDIQRTLITLLSLLK